MHDLGAAARTGVPDSPRALTKALPQMTPSAPQSTICLACSGLDTPNPTDTCSMHMRTGHVLGAASRQFIVLACERRAAPWHPPMHCMQAHRQFNTSVWGHLMN